MYRAVKPACDLSILLVVSIAAFWGSPTLCSQDADSHYRLALKYHTGKGKPKDRNKAVYWYEKATFHGNAEATYYLGLVYHWGPGTPENSSQAHLWFKRSAELGNKIAGYSGGSGIAAMLR